VGALKRSHFVPKVAALHLPDWYVRCRQVVFLSITLSHSLTSLCLQSSLPVSYNLSTSQTDQDPSSTNGSFWSSSFVHASNGHDYLVISNVVAGLPIPLLSSEIRASILDITNPSLYSEFAFLSNITNLYSTTGVLNASFDNYGFGSTSSTEGLSQLRTFSQMSGTEFDLTFDTSSPVLLNGGLGEFFVAGGVGLEWSMPAGKTAGWIGVNGTKVPVDSERSLTWYDRQWGVVPSSFTWFQVHIGGGDPQGPCQIVVLSIWDWVDPINGNKAFATMRTGVQGVQTVTPITSTPSTTKTFTSAITGITYPLEWAVELFDGTKLTLMSIRPDQETPTSNGPLSTYTGFLNVTAEFPSGQVSQGFGVVEILPSL
jgi:hypothetical protein